MDASFAEGGTAFIAFNLGGSDGDYGYAVALDGSKIVVAGSAETSTASECAVARLNPDGSMDTSFGTDGEVTLSINSPGHPDSQVDALAVQSNGKIVIAGPVQNAAGDSSDFGVARLNDDGTPDATFNGIGQVTTTFNTGYNIAQAIVLEQGGTILVGGQAPSTANGNGQLALARYTSGGALDPSLNIAGLELVPTVSGVDGIVGLAEAADGSIIALGENFDVVKLTHGGALDPSFGNNGIALNVGSSAVYGTSLALAPDGNIYAAGGTTYGSDSQMVISRVLPSGALDTSFGTKGVVNLSFGVQSTVFGIALQDNGAIVAAGDVQNGLTSNNVAVARLLGSDASPPRLVQLSVPALDPADTGKEGDGITAIARPAFVGTGADPGRLIILYDGSSSLILGTATAKADGTYSVVPSSPLSVGSHSVTVAEGDGQGFVGPRSGAFSVTVTAPQVSPTLVILTNGQSFDYTPILQTLTATIVGTALFGPLAAAGLVSFDIANGSSPTGSGRAGVQPWEQTASEDIQNQLYQSLAAEKTGVETLIVNWDTYGSIDSPASQTAQQIQQIVAGKQFNGLPWNLLFIGYSRGAIFNNNVIEDLNIPSDTRIAYTEAILLDPTAAKPWGDQFPASVPAGVDHEIVYDDGYAFPGSQIGGTILGLKLTYDLTAVDSNSASIPGDDYRFVQQPIAAYNYEEGNFYTGNYDVDSVISHTAVPYWYITNLPNAAYSTTALSQDVAQFIQNSDDGATITSPSANPSLFQFLNDPYVVFSPASSAPSTQNVISQIENEAVTLYNQAIQSAENLVNLIVQKADQLATQIATQAAALAQELINNAIKEGGIILAEARQQAAKLVQQAQAEANMLSAEAKDQAGQLLKTGQLFLALESSCAKTRGIHKIGQMLFRSTALWGGGFAYLIDKKARRMHLP